MKHVARKRFGQHFLTDRGIIEDIIQAINPKAGEPMVEIGPGLAAMTQPLVERLGHLTVIELDRPAGEPLDVYVNGRLVAHGEVVMVNERYGVRFTDSVSTNRSRR